MQRNSYLVHYPRGSANEYTVYAGPRADIDALARTLVGAGEIVTRARVVRLGWTRPRDAARTGESWYGGFAHCDGYPPTTLAEAIALACRATRDEIERLEWSRELDAAGV